MSGAVARPAAAASTARVGAGLATVVALLVAALLAGACAGGSAPAPSRSAADLTNPFLGVERSGWLIGPVSILANPEEISQFLALRDDAAAEQFIADFWARRDERVRGAFDERAAEADRRFSEAGYLGRRTDRGAIFIVYGEPTDSEYDTLHQDQDAGALEVWTYDETTPLGLDGRRPQARYRFTKRGDLTVLYQGPISSGPKLPRHDRF